MVIFKNRHVNWKTEGVGLVLLTLLILYSRRVEWEVGSFVLCGVGVGVDGTSGLVRVQR